MEKTIKHAHETTNNDTDFLIFQLGNEEYTVPALLVQEIRHLDKIIEVANSPQFVKGVYDLRGIVIPIIDLRILFHLPFSTYDDRTVIIVLHLANDMKIGVITDGVIDVIKISLANIKETTQLKSIIHSDFINGIAIVGNRALLLLDIQKLFSSEASPFLLEFANGQF